MTFRQDAFHPVVLVLPGGKVASRRRSRWWHLSNVRMRPFAALLRSRGIEVVRVRYRLRGWNGDARSPVADAQAVLDRIKETDPSPSVILLGHSMGGRVAAALAADPSVVGIVALAPWWPDGTAIDLRPGGQLVVVHGTADRWTDPAESRKQVEDMRRSGHNAEWIGVDGAGHFMLRRPALWHRLAVDAVSEMLCGVAAAETGERR
ncbi:pimeloyl-ACP methyl ester carboxylesterase [Rhodococcus sp. 27YEA15]|uniref:alpha/beta hydrolase n=1 Tax=Rhodococcus sp. 27YEA15 TaxID=3156259 RepID=UPI003C7D8282